MKKEYKARETFARNAGSAMVALVGVNDQLDFTDIKKVKNLLEYSKNSYYFNNKLVEYRNELESIDRELNPSRVFELEDEIKWCTGCVVTWEIAYIKEMNVIQKKNASERNVEGAIWELEMLAKIATEAAIHLKSSNTAYMHYSSDID